MRAKGEMLCAEIRGPIIKYCGVMWLCGDGQGRGGGATAHLHIMHRSASLFDRASPIK